MSDPKVTYHGPGSRERSSGQKMVVLPTGGKSLRRKRDDSQNVATNGQGVNSQLAVNALRRWWMIAMPIGLLLAAAAVTVVYWQFEPQYEAAAYLEITEPTWVAFEPKD